MSLSPPQPSRWEGRGVKAYAARVHFGELAGSWRCKWAAPLVSLTHCTGGRGAGSHRLGKERQAGLPQAG